jgi:hypothetical protein
MEGSLIGVPGVFFSPLPELLVEPSEEEDSSEDCVPEEASLEEELSDGAGVGLAFEALLAGSLAALAVGSLAGVVVELAGALAGGLLLVWVTSAAIARWASVAASAGEPDGLGPSAAPATIPSASTQAASTPATRRDGAPTPRGSGCASVGDDEVQNAVKSIRGLPRRAPHRRQ